MKLTLEDVDIRCGDGCIPIIQRALDELNDAKLQMYGMVFGEDQGRLRVDYNSPGEFRSIARILLLAQCRAFYACEVCGAPGEHRADRYGWKSTRCTEHQSEQAKAGRLVFDAVRTPWRQMTDGRWRFDPVGDALVRIDA